CMTKETRKWVKKAEEDFRAAGALWSVDKIFNNQICFHCQQSAEKYLKALMEERSLFIPKIHDLVKLFQDLRNHHPSLISLKGGYRILSFFAVAARYPGADTTKRQATSALRWATKIRR